MRRRARPGRVSPRAMSGWFVTHDQRQPGVGEGPARLGDAGQDLASRSRGAAAAGTPSTTEASVEHPVAVEEDGRPALTGRATCAGLESASIAVIDSRSASAEPPVGASRAPRIRSVSSRTTGTSPFQPRSPARRRSSTVARVEAEHLERELGDLAHGDVVAGGDVEGVERARPAASTAAQHGGARRRSTWM